MPISALAAAHRPRLQRAPLQTAATKQKISHHAFQTSETYYTAFWISIPSLQVVSRFVFSVASLDRSQDYHLPGCDNFHCQILAHYLLDCGWSIHMPAESYCHQAWNSLSAPEGIGWWTTQTARMGHV